MIKGGKRQNALIAATARRRAEWHLITYESLFHPSRAVSFSCSQPITHVQITIALRRPPSTYQNSLEFQST